MEAEWEVKRSRVVIIVVVIEIMVVDCHSAVSGDSTVGCRELLSSEGGYLRSCWTRVVHTSSE